MNKIAMLLNPAVRSRVFAAAALERMSRLANELAVPAEPLSPEGSAALIRGAEAAVTSWMSPQLNEELLDEAPDLKIVLHAAGSVKPVVSEALQARGIRVVSAASVLSRGVAETALGLTIVSLKNIWDIADRTRDGDWWNNRADETRSRIRELFGVTIGCIGAGQAGRRYLELLRHFRVDVLLYDPTVSAEQAVRLGARSVSLEELMAASDVVTVLAPEIPATYHMINERTLSAMKDDAILINLARGSLVDEQALRRRLERGSLRVILDVTDPEPPPSGHWLRTHPRVILTGHIAGAVNNGLLAIGDFIADELERYRSGEALTGEVDLSRLHLLA
ncbi:hydroxyacid dehydrogenase [Paenibacillus cisolokensis]|uniref:hydroxyacid dehydrogenase n=1 Tax=Paenibacillus cisolokensis TaxID=1658519 RepID=UPI003D2C47DC